MSDILKKEDVLLTKFLKRRGYTKINDPLICPSCDTKNDVGDWDPEDDYNRLACTGCDGIMHIKCIIESAPCYEYQGFKAIESLCWLKALYTAMAEDL